MRLCAAFLLLISCYYMPVGNVIETSIYDMRDKATLSFFVIAFLYLLSIEWWSIAISTIELFLITVTFFVLLQWPAATPLVSYYGAIQSTAFTLEILIIVGAMIDGGRTILGRFADYCKHLFNMAGY